MLQRVMSENGPDPTVHDPSLPLPLSSEPLFEAIIFLLRCNLSSSKTTRVFDKKES
jgi:hypothetical protein